MPQYLKIKVEDKLVGHLRTGNLGHIGEEYRYRVDLDVHELNDLRLEPVFADTPVRCMQDADDLQCASRHARRCIAAAVACADEFSEQLRRSHRRGDPSVKPISMKLTTNCNGRGEIVANPGDDGALDVKVHIKNGNPEHDPLCAWNWSKQIDTPKAASHTERSLKILKSITEDEKFKLFLDGRTDCPCLRPPR
jgi:hypothetical protein